MSNIQLIRRLFLLLFLLLSTNILLAPSLATARYADSQEGQINPGVNVISSNEAELYFQLHTAAFQINQDGDLQVAGLDQRLVEPGAPDLPYYSTFIAVPPQATVSVSVKESGLSEHRAIKVLPVPEQQLGAEADAAGMLVADPQSITELAPVYAEDDAIYALDAPFPKLRFEVSEPQYLRDLRLVELKLFPLRYNPGTETLLQASDLSVNISFSGGKLADLNATPGFVDDQADSLRDSVLNFDQAQAWRSLPQTKDVIQQIAELPIGVDTFKILVDQDGIYEISADELKSQGMELPVDPNTIEMMNRGLPVAFQFINANANGQFDEGDKIRFYGWAFDGSRYEQMYVEDNVYWLWAGGSANTVPLRDNESGSGNLVTTFVDSVTRHDENDNFSGWGILWENEPTIWQWDLITSFGTTVSRSYDIELFDPVAKAAENSVTVELTTRESNPTVTPIYTVKTSVNDFTPFDESNWTGRLNLNVVNLLPGSGLKQPNEAGYPDNQVTIEFSSDSAGPVSIFLTSITIEYTRLLKAVEDQLIFSSKPSGHHDFHVAGFRNGSADSVIVWDISNRRLPEEIDIQAQNILQNGSEYTYVIGRSHAQDAQFIATTINNIQSVKGISLYKPVSLNPPSGESQWLAISHSSLLPAANKLANYRKKDYSTWVVDIEDVINQVGSGFNTPQTIRNYLFHALANWETAPEYVTLFGDTTRNPLGQDCPLCGAWDKDAPTLLVTDFAFVDRWNGMVPSDFSMSLLVGNDLLPDIYIGRMPANTLSEANAMVQKTINYENQRPDDLLEWQRNFLFVADDPDGGGNFCNENIHTSYNVPRGPYQQTHLCLPYPTAVDTEALRLEMGKQVNDIGLSIMNFRGHGSATAWAGSSGSPNILSEKDIDFWQNVGRPVVILSADCLDGYFIFTHTSALGETFLRLSNRGSVAHWSSSGLGFSSEHSVLHANYYEGLFKYRYKELGKAINHAKIEYYQAGQFPSELYSFVLLGDPALKILPKVETAAFFPFVKARF